MGNHRAGHRERAAGELTGMPLLSRLASLRRNLFTRARIEHDLDDELRSYVDQLTDQKSAAVMSVAEARSAAFIELGGLE